MRTHFKNFAWIGALAMATVSFVETDAHACGGCFHRESDPQSTVVTGHRMALSISPTQTVLWDQVRYSGSPSEFAWVLPIKPGARLEVGNNAWFEALDAATTTRVFAPQIFCAPQGGFSDEGYSGGYDGFGCGCAEYEVTNSGGYSAGGQGVYIPEVPPPPPVTVVQRETVGPYDVVTLSAQIPGVLVDWLKTNGFAVDAEIAPLIDQYTNEGFDFIAMRLIPTAGVQDMRPVRVISSGASPVLPLRMVAAGTGPSTALTLFVVGEGRWEAKNFPNALINGSSLIWDFAQSSSNYSQIRAKKLKEQEGRTWLTTSARADIMFLPRTVTWQGQDVQQSAENPSITGLFIQAGQMKGDIQNDACWNRIAPWIHSQDLVVPGCKTNNEGGAGGMGGSGGSAEMGGMGGAGGSMSTGGAGGMGGGGSGGAGGAECMIESGQIDSLEFACRDASGQPSFDDLAVALTGLHPASVWVTRLEAELPRAALATDLELTPANQSSVDHWIGAQGITNPPCTLEAGVLPEKPNHSANARRKRKELAAMMMLALCLALAAGRRALGRARSGVLAEPT